MKKTPIKPNANFVQSFSYSSPLPPPEVLSKYQAINPQFVEIIIRYIEKEQTHRHFKEQEIIKLEQNNLQINEKATYKHINTTRIGQGFAFIICLILILFAYLVKDNPFFAGAVVFTTVATIASSVFIYQKNKTKQ
jgi:uncharacterized membrane protein